MRRNIGNILWGLLFIAVGIGLIGNIFEIWDYNIFFDGWWTLFLILPALISMFQGGIKASNLIMLAIGGILLLDRQQIIPEGMVFRFAAPVILIIIGLNIISKVFYKDSGKTILSSKKSSSEDNPDYIAIFSGNDVKNSSRNLTGGSATAIFGGNDIDLSEVKLAGDVKFTVTSIFGGNDIKAPKDARVEMNGIPILGGNENSAVSSDSPDAHTITFVCTSIFGGTDIS